MWCRLRFASYRLLRTDGVVSPGLRRGFFALTELGQPLRQDSSRSAWPGVVFWADLLADNWSHLTECVRLGTTANTVMESKGIASRWAQDPEAPAIFRAVMGTAPAENYQPIVVAWNFADSRVVADLGGGGGGLMCAILKTHPNLRGMLVDRQASVDAAVARFDAEGLSNRCKLIGADLAESVPAGADTYVIKHVLHGCRDDAAIRILQNCRQVIPDDGRLLVIEFVLPDVISQAPILYWKSALMSDLNMLAVTGWQGDAVKSNGADLLQSAGFSLQQVIPLSRSVSSEACPIIEAVPFQG